MTDAVASSFRHHSSMDFVLETPRLRLRRMVMGDLDFVASMLGDPWVMRFYPEVQDREESAEWIRRQRDRYLDDGHGLWLMVERATGLPCGQIGLCMQRVNDRDVPEIGYLVHRPYWRRGYATEAAFATRAFAFDTRGYARVVSLIRPENLPSQGVARKLGMRPGPIIEHGGRPHAIFSVERGAPTRRRA
jgi:RimJ/RimL family protein N-acetyltransferase